MKLHVFYSTKTSTEIIEEPKYTRESLLVSLGGAVSLFLGISVVALFEFVELAARALYKLVTKSNAN